MVEVLRGANNQRIREMGHDKLPVYGIGREQSHEHWVSVIRQLIHLGLVTQNIAQHSALQLTEAARPVLRGEDAAAARRAAYRGAEAKGDAEILWRQLRP